MGVPLGPGFRSPTNSSICPSLSGLFPQQMSPSFNFQKAAGMTLLLTLLSLSFCRRTLVSFSFFCCYFFHFSGTERGQIFHSFGRIKRHPIAWSSAEVKEAVSERRKAFAAAQRMMKIAKLTSPLPIALCLSSPWPRLRHGRRLAFLSGPNLTLNLYILFFALLLALLYHLPPLLTFPTVPFPGNRLRSSPIT